MQKQALAGVKVCDFTWAIAGPFMTKYLADYGATVVRVESASRPCFLRFSGPYKDGEPGMDRSGYFAFFNSNKYSISLDLNNGNGLEVAKRLIAWADIVCENFTPGIMEKWNLGYEEIKKINPEVVMVRSSGQGQEGPYSKVPIGGNWLTSLTGFTWASGWPDRPPVQPFGVYTDFIAPRFAVAATLAALDYRRRTGIGQCLDISQLEAGMQLLSPLLLDYIVNDREERQKGNSSPCAAPHGVYPCCDGQWCAIAVFSPRQWEAFCQVLGNPKWTKDRKFATLLGRKKNEEELNNLVSKSTSTLNGREIVEQLQSLGVPAGMVQNTKDLRDDPQLKYRHAFWDIDHPILGKYCHLGQAAILSKTPARPRMPAPCLGQHTEYVCREFLKISNEEFVDLLARGAFGDF